jgi:hypothetical protein
MTRKMMVSDDFMLYEFKVRSSCCRLPTESRPDFWYTAWLTASPAPQPPRICCAGAPLHAKGVVALGWRAFGSTAALMGRIGGGRRCAAGTVAWLSATLDTDMRPRCLMNPGCRNSRHSGTSSGATSSRLADSPRHAGIAGQRASSSKRWQDAACLVHIAHYGEAGTLMAISATIATAFVSHLVGTRHRLPRVQGAHSWTECPYTHPGEKASRRCPRKHVYAAEACPDARKVCPMCAVAWPGASMRQHAATPTVHPHVCWVHLYHHYHHCYHHYCHQRVSPFSLPLTPPPPPFPWCCCTTSAVWQVHPGRCMPIQPRRV